MGCGLSSELVSRPPKTATKTPENSSLLTVSLLNPSVSPCFSRAYTSLFLSSISFDKISHIFKHPVNSFSMNTFAPMKKADCSLRVSFSVKRAETCVLNLLLKHQHMKSLKWLKCVCSQLIKVQTAIVVFLWG